MGAPRGRWTDLTTTDFAAIDPERTVAVLPLGAVEQHGPHLPLDTDARIAEGILDAAWTHLAPDLPVLTLPPVRVGMSAEHVSFPGTLSADTDTLTRYVAAIGTSVAGAGVRKLVLLNAHGGQTHVLDAAALDLRRRCGMLAVKANYFGFGVPADLVADHEIDHGIHGGLIETAMMLHLAPDVVRMARAGAFDSLRADMAAGHRHLRPGNRIGFAWLAEDLNADGVAGDAAGADAATGAHLVDHFARALATLIAETAAFDMGRLGRGTSA
jgi:creatinine amidohydrolase